MKGFAVRTLTMLAALALVSCGDSNDALPAVDHPVTLETGAAAQVAKLDEGVRNGVLERAIKASGAQCPAVTASQRAEVRPGVQGWKTQCDNGTGHLIEIQADGTAKVTSRTD